MSFLIGILAAAVFGMGAIDANKEKRPSPESRFQEKCSQWYVNKNTVRTNCWVTYRRGQK